MRYSDRLSKLDRFDYFYFFVIVIYAAMALPATKNMVKPPSGGIIAFIIPWGLTAIFIVKHKISFIDRKLTMVTLIYFVWVILQIIKYRIVYDGAFIYYGNILIAYILIKIYGYRMFLLYEKFIFFLSIIALLGWGLQIIAPAPLTLFMKATSLYGFSQESTIVANNIFFSLSNYSKYLAQGYIIPRNAGFASEPGRFAVMLVFAILSNLIRTRFSLKHNRIFWILSFALISSQSTTGLSGFMLILFIYFLNQKVKKRVTLIIVFIPLALGIILLPFMGEKISELWFNNEDVQNAVYLAQYREEGDRVLVPQRFVAIIFELMNIKDSPLLGYGIDTIHSYVRRNISPFISLPGGVFAIVSQFGVVIAFLVYRQLYKSSFYFQEIYRYKGKWVIFILFILMSLSYSLWFAPFFSTIWLFHLFTPSKSKLVLKQHGK
ncbi:MAG: hypothetical protein ABGW99_16210 [Zunongwangia sp.]|uniref:hypothetical protein n=1 Tax=Zunongwangia sp. TaxID=1965325 RepID=UPI0032421286